MRRLALLGLVIVGCSEARGLDRADAAATPVVQTGQPSAISVLRAHHLAAASGFRSGTIDAVLPARVDRPLKITIPGRAGAWLEIVAEGAQRGAAHDRWGHRPRGRAPRDGPGPRRRRQQGRRAARPPQRRRAHQGELDDRARPDITALRVNGARVEAVDEEDHVVMSSEPIFAIDARDVRRTPTIRIEGDRLIVDLDTAGLEYPVVLDPSWITSTPSTMLAGRSSPIMSSSPTGASSSSAA